MANEYSIHRRGLRDFPFSFQWRTALVRLPRYTPRISLRITSPEGLYPFIVKIPSRTREHEIPIWVFLPTDPEDLAAVPVHHDFHGGGFILGTDHVSNRLLGALSSQEKGTLWC